MTAGYSKLTPHKMTADKACRIVGRSDDDAIIFDSCHSPEGFSGGPILAAAPDGGVYSVLGIHVGSQVWQGKGIAIAVLHGRQPFGPRSGPASKSTSASSSTLPKP